ncbi:MAG TPA: hypothetical protein VHB50_16615 [Bryobacteraceae bacterium]|nr:hypothetical protein [Bryobacteraceae bacterium]
MIQYRRLAALLLGTWLGAGIFADIAVTQNFQTVDRFLATPGSATTTVELNQIGRARERVILRRNAGEENNFLFENWEWAELILGGALTAVLLFGERPNKWMLAAAGAMFLIVAVQRFWLTPEVTDLGRQIADLSPKDPLNAKFWTLHGIYSGIEILKLVIGAALAIRLVNRSKLDRDHFAKEYDALMASGGKRG